MSTSVHDSAATAATAVSGATQRQFVTFIVGDEVFAVDMAPVQEIIRAPAVVRVPLAPPTLDGLANLRGRVLPIVSLRRLFGFADRAHDDATRAVVIDLGQPLGFVVDRVVSVVGVDVAQIEDTGAIRAAVDTELVAGLLKNVSGYPMVMVLDVERIIAAQFAGSAAVKGVVSSSAGAGAGAPVAAAELEHSNDELHLVNFEVAGQEYAIAIDDVQEIVQVPAQIVKVPNAGAHVLGVITLRQRLLPLISLRCMFGLPERAVDEHSRIVVVTLGGAAVGIVMDSVNAVLRVARAEVDAMPALLAADDAMSDITQICRLDGGKRLVAILSVDNLFRHQAVRAALAGADAMTGGDDAQAAGAGEAGADDEEQVVVFLLGEEEFAAPIDSVQEIVRVADTLTRVPKAPPEVEGVINLRGAVLPVMDLRRRLGLAAIDRSDRQRIMVFLVDGARTGFIVDSVVEVLMLPKSAIVAAPRLSAAPPALLSRMANLEQAQRLLQLIDPEYLVDAGGRAALASMAA
ncbi:chemotaxis protein CheW [Massilia sp. PWRC2]|uniref:chemotaxis protein CheW n=1 Tax=Massilia sp. PWRC2 TaxID=2804626 RepID=UPI003CF772BF